jgi:hypothetical protein
MNPEVIDFELRLENIETELEIGSYVNPYDINEMYKELEEFQNKGPIDDDKFDEFENRIYIATNEAVEL